MLGLTLPPTRVGTVEQVGVTRMRSSRPFFLNSCGRRIRRRSADALMCGYDQFQGTTAMSSRRSLRCDHECVISAHCLPFDRHSSMLVTVCEKINVLCGQDSFRTLL